MPHKPRFGGGIKMEEHTNSPSCLSTGSAWEGQLPGQQAAKMEEKAKKANDLQTRTLGEGGIKDFNQTRIAGTIPDTQFQTSVQPPGNDGISSKQDGRFVSLPNRVDLQLDSRESHKIETVAGRADLMAEYSIPTEDSHSHRADDMVVREAFNTGKSEKCKIFSLTREDEESFLNEKPTKNEDRRQGGPSIGQTSAWSVPGNDNNDGLRNVRDDQDNPFHNLISLMDIFDTIGIGAKPRFYTKLSNEQLHCEENKKLFHQERFSDTFSSLHEKLSSSQDNIVCCKNLFLKDRKGQFYLVITEENCEVDLKLLKNHLNASRNLSFADEKSIESILGLKPGEVTPFAIMHQSARDVRVIFHESLSFVHESSILMAFHPFSSLLQVEIQFLELERFIAHCGKHLEILQLQQKSQTPSKSTDTGIRLNTTGMLKYKEEDTKQKEKKTKHTKHTSKINIEEGSELGKGKEGSELGKGKEGSELGKGKVIDLCNDATSSTHQAFTPQNDEEDRETVEEIMNPVGEQVMKRPNFLESSKSSILTSKSHSNVETKKRIKNIVGERKGKLKSLLKKNATQFGQSSKQLSIDEMHEGKRVALDSNVNENMTRQICCKVEGLSENIRRKDDLSQLSPKTTLPEIEEFYHLLRHYTENFQEVDVGRASSKDIGPALGVRGFLFKDGHQNYFFIVSHEFYEPDYGRLKRAVQPKRSFDPCHIYELMDVLGVDDFHLTPFAVMNHRARRHKVKVFFTEKIISPNIVLCCQHPFAQGRRIVMTSLDLQCFVARFSSSDDVGVVEEKPWHPRYNKIFTQFGAVGAAGKVETELKDRNGDNIDRNCKNEMRHFDIVGNKMDSSNSSNIEIDQRFNTVIDHRRQMSRTILSPKQLVRASFWRMSAQRLNSFFCHDVPAMIGLFSRDEDEVNKGHDRSLYCSNPGSSVDGGGNEAGEDEGLEYDNPTGVQVALEDFYKDEQDSTGNESKDPYKNEDKNASKPFEFQHDFPYNRVLFAKSSTFSSLQEETIPERIVDKHVPRRPDVADDEGEDLGCCAELTETMLLTTVKKTDVSLEDVGCHLEEHGIKFSIEDYNSFYHGKEEVESCETVEDQSPKESDENSGVIQVCFTQHLLDRWEGVHYLVVGRDLEHIPSRRVCRRFNISNHLSIIHEGIGGSSQNDDVKTKANLTDPFSVFLSTSKEKSTINSSSTSTTQGAVVRYKLILHTSIYMDPGMTCVFSADGSRSSVCMTSQELERYGKLVGMEILHMP